LVRAVVKGEAGNPLVSQLDEVSKLMEVITTYYDHFRWVIESQGLSCKPLSDFPGLEEARENFKLIFFAQQLLSTNRIYPNYKFIVHGQVCHSLIANVGFLFATVVVLGMVVFPLTAILVQTYLSRLRIWNRARDLQVEDEELEDEEDADCSTASSTDE